MTRAARRRGWGAAVLALGVPLVLARLLGLGQAAGGEVCAPPDYETFLPPEVGGRFADPIFGTVIRRVSDATKTLDAGRGRGQVGFVANEYSTMSPFSSDLSRLLLLHESYFALYDGEGAFLRNLPFDVGPASEPRWSRAKPSVFFYLNGNELRQFDVSTWTASTVHTFAEYRAVRGHGESDLCFDGNHLVLAGDSRYVFVYDLSTGRKGTVFDAGGRSFDSLYITPDDNVTITWNEAGTSRYQGIELFDRNMDFLRQVTRAGGHMDVTRDVDGREVLVWANAGDPSPICKNGVVKVRLADGQQTCLLSLDWSLALHVSAPDRGGFALVSTHADGDPRPDRGWKPYTNEILALSLDGAHVWRLAHHRSRPFNDYWWQPRASVSHDGTRLVYTSNHGLQAILGHPRDYADTYLITQLQTFFASDGAAAPGRLSGGLVTSSPEPPGAGPRR